MTSPFDTPKKSRPKKPGISDSWKLRYQQAHEEDFKSQYPMTYKDGHYLEPNYPKVETSNGMQTFIINFINWHGYRATRINVQGRLIDAQEKQASGATLGVKKWIKSSTRKDTADVSSTIAGRSVMWEIKVGKDKPRPEQLKEQIKERKAGGEYFFVSTPAQFYEFYDQIQQGRQGVFQL